MDTDAFAPRVVDTDTSKEATVRLSTFDAQSAAPSASHSPSATRTARNDRNSAGEGDGSAVPPTGSNIDGGTSASGDGGQTLNAQPQAQLPLAPSDISGVAKTVTVVSKASPAVAPSPGDVGARLRDALASVSNHAVLRGEASGQIDVPDLGRVAVRAHSTGGTVDVEVTAESSDARAMLHGHVGAMTADLHAADVPVGRFTIDRSDAAFGGSLGSSTSSPGGDPNQGGSSARDGGPQTEGDDASQATEAAVPRRVRIVL